MGKARAGTGDGTYYPFHGDTVLLRVRKRLSKNTLVHLSLHLKD